MCARCISVCEGEKTNVRVAPGAQQDPPAHASPSSTDPLTALQLPARDAPRPTRTLRSFRKKRHGMPSAFREPFHPEHPQGSGERCLGRAFAGRLGDALLPTPTSAGVCQEPEALLAPAEAGRSRSRQDPLPSSARYIPPVCESLSIGAGGAPEENTPCSNPSNASSPQLPPTKDTCHFPHSFLFSLLSSP